MSSADLQLRVLGAMRQSALMGKTRETIFMEAFLTEGVAENFDATTLTTMIERVFGMVTAELQNTNPA